MNFTYSAFFVDREPPSGSPTCATAPVNLKRQVGRLVREGACVSCSHLGPTKSVQMTATLHLPNAPLESLRSGCYG